MHEALIVVICCINFMIVLGLLVNLIGWFFLAWLVYSWLEERDREKGPRKGEKNMRTVKSLREELRKFPDDAQCFAYEGEVDGLVIKHPYYRNQGVIHCGEEEREEKETRLLRRNHE